MDRYDRLRSVNKADLMKHIESQGNVDLREDTVVSKTYFEFIRQYDRRNIPIGICEFLDRNLLDDESYRIASSIVMADYGAGSVPQEEAQQIVGPMNNHKATRWEAMTATGFANLIDEEDGCYYEIDVTKLGRYIRYMGFTNPFSEDEP